MHDKRKFVVKLSPLESFFVGVGAVLDIGGTSAPNVYVARRRSPMNDMANLTDDWDIVADEFNRAARHQIQRRGE